MLLLIYVSKKKTYSGIQLRTLFISRRRKEENVLNILVSFLTRVQFTIPFYTENIETKDDISHKVKLIKQMDR